MAGPGQDFPMTSACSPHRWPRETKVSGMEERSGRATGAEAGSLSLWSKACPPLLEAPSISGPILEPQRMVESQGSGLGR